MNNNARMGEKIGWIGGWIGGFMWVFIIAIVLLFKKQNTEAITGFLLSILAFTFIFMFAPWKYPETQYWKLMLPLLLMFVPSLAWVIWSFGTDEEEFNLWTFLWLIPLILPLLNHGKRKWSDLEKQDTKQIMARTNYTPRCKEYFFVLIATCLINLLPLPLFGENITLVTNGIPKCSIIAQSDDVFMEPRIFNWSPRTPFLKWAVDDLTNYIYKISGAKLVVSNAPLTDFIPIFVGCSPQPIKFPKTTPYGDAYTCLLYTSPSPRDS